jgi:hypothetical protein
MSFWSKLGGAVANIAAEVIPGGKIIKGVVEAVVGGGSSQPVIQVPKAQLTGGGNVGLPALVSSASGGLPALSLGGSAPLVAAAGTTAAIGSQTVGTLPFWRGPGGKLQAPWQDPNIPEYLKQFALDDAYLRICYRAPRGYVVIRDKDGRPFAVNKWIAQKAGIWKPNPKPLLTATDVRALRRAATLKKTVARLNKLYGPKLVHHSSTAPTTKKRGK